jgi:hypothetical protein
MRRSGFVTRSFGVTMARPAHVAAPVRPPVVISNRPTPQFTCHHDVAAPQVDNQAFRQGWRVCSRLDGLLESGCIDRDAWSAANDWRKWAETITPYGAQRYEARVDTSATPDDYAMLRRVDAATQLRAAANALGDLRARLLEAAVLHDVSWGDLGRSLRVSDKTARRRTIEAIEALADWRSGRAVAPAPGVRYRIEPGRQ